MSKDASSKDYVCLIRLFSDLACVSNSQSSCVVVETWLHCVVLLHDKISASMTMLFVLAIYAMHTLCAVVWYFTDKALASNITVQYHSALLAHAHPTMFYIPLVIWRMQLDGTCSTRKSHTRDHTPYCTAGYNFPWGANFSGSPGHRWQVSRNFPSTKFSTHCVALSTHPQIWTSNLTLLLHNHCTNLY